MKAVIPAAGLGTRFLPLTKEPPKEMLPVVDRPAIHWVVEEAVAAGATDILIITGREKRVIEDYFESSLRWDHYVKGSRNGRPIRELAELASRDHFHFIRPHAPCGLGDAVLHAETHVGSPQRARFEGRCAKPDPQRRHTHLSHLSVAHLTGRASPGRSSALLGGMVT